MALIAAEDGQGCPPAHTAAAWLPGPPTTAGAPQDPFVSAGYAVVMLGASDNFLEWFVAKQMGR